MPRRSKNAPPTYLRKRVGAKVYAQCWFMGKVWSLGVYGSTESHQRYDEILARWRAMQVHPEQAVQAPARKVADIVARFLVHAEVEYAHSRELKSFRNVARPLLRLYGSLPAKDFDAKCLEVLGRAIAGGTWMNDQERARYVKMGWPIGCCRNVGNRHLVRVKTMWRWAEKEGHVPRGSYEHLRTARGLSKRDRSVRSTPHVTPADQELVNAVLPHCSRGVAAMVGLQWLVGMRSCEVRIMRTVDIDRTGPVWLYRPARHKNDWRETDQPRVVPLGPECQRILTPWLRDDTPEGWIFRPLDRRRTKDGREVYREACYSAFSYAQAVRRAARAAGVSLHPYQLRHGAKMRITRELGLDAARALLGQKSLGTTNLYAAGIDLKHASEAAKRLA